MSDVLILANSYKEAGRCVAGIDLGSGRWVRPVSDSKSGELSVQQTRASREDGTWREVRPLDIVTMQLGAQLPSLHHPEDIERRNDTWLGRSRWATSIVLERHRNVLATGPELLGTRRDHLKLTEIRQLGAQHQSLTLVRPGHVDFYVRTTAHSGKPQLRAHFALADQHYDLSVTDVRYSVDDLPPAGDHVLTVSLAVPWQPKWATEQLCYKIAAAVMSAG